MATFLDLTGLEQFSKFFVFIFVWLSVYAMLSYSRVIQNHAINIILGMIIGLFVLLSPVLSGAIRFIAPWFAVALVFIMLISVLVTSFGAGDMPSYIHLKNIFIVLIIGTIIVGFFGYIRENTIVHGDNESVSDRDYTKTINVLFHPNIIGMIFLALVSVFTIALLAGKSS